MNYKTISYPARTISTHRSCNSEMKTNHLDVREEQHKNQDLDKGFQDRGLQAWRPGSEQNEDGDEIKPISECDLYSVVTKIWFGNILKIEFMNSLVILSLTQSNIYKCVQKENAILIKFSIYKKLSLSKPQPVAMSSVKELYIWWRMLLHMEYIPTQPQKQWKMHTEQKKHEWPTVRTWSPSLSHINTRTHTHTHLVVHINNI